MDTVEFGRYRLLGLIGEGGMGQVFKAHDTAIGRDVAIKVLHIELASEPGYRERFRREAHTAAQLTEPHIIPIFDTGEIDGRLYLVMPVIGGIDVASLLKRDGPMSPRLAVRVVEQLAGALDAAHAHGLVHRDVKPSNALMTGMTGREFVYLIDFGITHDSTATKLTRTGSVLGTLAYMAPERFTTGKADPRADIYALACVLHECLTGEQPFPGDSMEQQITGHLTLDPPQPSVQRPGVPAGFDEVIARGMAKNPDERYQNAHNLATAAEQALTEPAHARSPHTAPTLIDESDQSGQATSEPMTSQPTDPTGAPTQLRAAEQPTLDANTQPPPQPAPPRPPATPPAAPTLRRNRRIMAIAGAAVVIAAIAALVGYLVWVAPSDRDAQQIPRAFPVPQTRYKPQVRLEFTGFARAVVIADVAVDAAGSVYVADHNNNSVLKMAAGSTATATLPFTGLSRPAGVAVDSAGSVYVADVLNNRVLKLPAGSNTQVELPFNGLNLFSGGWPKGIAADTAGSIYVADSGNNRVLKLPAGSNTQTVLPFTGLNAPLGVAVDAAGSVYVADNGNNRVLKLPAGSNAQIELPFTGLSVPGGVAVDDAGSVYVTGNDFSGPGDSASNTGRVLKLSAGSNTPITLPFTNITYPDGIALDSTGSVYISVNSIVLKLPTG